MKSPAQRAAAERRKKIARILDFGKSYSEMSTEERAVMFRDGVGSAALLDGLSRNRVTAQRDACEGITDALNVQDEKGLT